MTRSARRNFVLAVFLQLVAKDRFGSVEASAGTVEVDREYKGALEPRNVSLFRRAGIGLDLNEPAEVDIEEASGRWHPPQTDQVGRPSTTVDCDAETSGPDEVEPLPEGVEFAAHWNEVSGTVRPQAPRRRTPLTEEQKELKRSKNALYRSMIKTRSSLHIGPATKEQFEMSQRKKRREIIDRTLQQYGGSLGLNWTREKADVFRNALEAEGLPAGTNQELSRRVRWIEVGRLQAKGLLQVPATSEEEELAKEQTRLMNQIIPAARFIPDFSEREEFVLNAFATHRLPPPQNLHKRLLRMSQVSVLKALKGRGTGKGQSSSQHVSNQDREEIIISSSKGKEAAFSDEDEDEDAPPAYHEYTPDHLQKRGHELGLQRRSDATEERLLRRAGGLDIDLNEIGSGEESEHDDTASLAPSSLPTTAENQDRWPGYFTSGPAQSSQIPSADEVHVQDPDPVSEGGASIAKRKAGRPSGYVVSEETKERTRRTKLINYERRTAQGRTEKSLVLLGVGSKLQRDRIHRREAKFREALATLEKEEPTSPKSRLSYVVYGLPPITEDDTLRSMYEKVCDVFSLKDWPRPDWDEARKKIYQAHFSMTRAKPRHPTINMEGAQTHLEPSLPPVYFQQTQQQQMDPQTSRTVFHKQSENHESTPDLNSRQKQPAAENRHVYPPHSFS